MATETVVEGVVDRITFESPESSFRVIKLAVPGRAERLAVVGTLPSMPLGARVRVRGTLEIDRTHGEQLRADSLIELAPDTLSGLEKYLGSGFIRGVGPKIAGRIVAAFGLDSLRVLDDEPQRLGEVEGLGDKRRGELSRAWREQRETRDAMVFLQSHGVSAALAARILRRYGARAMALVSRDPYRLALDVNGVGFKTADRIASSLGVAVDSPQRLQAGVLQVLHDVTEAGHVWTGRDEVVGRAEQMLALDPAEAVRQRVELAVDALVEARRAVVETTGREAAVYTTEMHTAEVRLARRLADIARAPSRTLEGVAGAIVEFESLARVELAPEQKHAVQEAARRHVLVVTGGPGVGKTTIVRAILAVLARARVDVRLAAPTGRAAKRLSEATGVEASTLHRLLDFDPRTARFKRNEAHPIDAGAVVVDEASMLDLAMADSLLRAIAPGTRLLLVGDVDQLASVGAGAVLRDVIESGAVPCVRLEQIFRQAARSLIVTNAHRIHAGEAPVSAGPGDNADFFMVERSDPERARSTVLELVTSRIPDRFGLDPVRDIQVITPMNRGAAGSLSLNDALQAALNPRRPGSGGAELTRGARVYRVGDKVMQLRNDYEKNVFNGDIGFVTSIESKATGPTDLASGDGSHASGTSNATMVVRFDERSVSFEASQLNDLALAYACTVHKSQGSEYPAVVMPLLTAHFVMLSRNLLYTAVTRGKRLVVLVCDPRALELAISAARTGERRTRLAERLAQELA